MTASAPTSTTARVLVAEDDRVARDLLCEILRGEGYEVDAHEWDVAPPEAGAGSAGLGDVLPDERRVALVASIVVLAALLLLAAVGLSFIWWRYHQSAKSLTIMAENINLHESEELKAAIQQSAHDNYVGPWLSSFLKRRGL